MPRLFQVGRKGAEAVAVVVFLGLFGTFLLQIFMRYVVNYPLSWTIEACMITYIWVVFWSSAFLLRERDHVAFTVLLEAAPPRGRRVMALAGALAVGLAFLFAYLAEYEFITFMKIDVTPALHLRFDWVFSVWLLFAAMVIFRSGQTVLRLLGPDWRRHVADPAPLPPTGPEI